MTSRSTLAAIRFGTGLGPRAVETDADAMMDFLRGPDLMAVAFAQESFGTRASAALAFSQARSARRQSVEAEAAFGRVRDQLTVDHRRQLVTMAARGVATQDGLRERLAWFWADHFTTTGTRAVMRGSITAYIEEAIRPHVAGRFGDMLEAAILHPVMILFLDQESSAGPNSQSSQRRPRNLNENLARELLELHTLGVDAGYTQRDVQEMAELLTGIGITRGRNIVFRPGNAEPGPETVFGVTYGGADPADLSEVRAALQDLAMRPETARHLSRKLADYFLSDTPDPALIESMTAVYLQTGGDLADVVQTMLSHSSAWANGPGRVKRPFHFLVSAIRALEIHPNRLIEMDARDVKAHFILPLLAMGQRWQGAAGPDGFFDDDREWVRPQSLAARIGWAMTVPQYLRRRLPDPRRFVQTALADFASNSVQWAAARAETRAEGVGIVLSSPDFLRS